MIVTFKEKYLEMKDNGLSDKQIAEIMGFGKDKMVRLKRINGVSYPVKTTRNRTGFTQKEINVALKNGLTSKQALRRVRELGWSVSDAIHTPIGKRRISYGELTAYEMMLDEKTRQKGYYEMRKRKVVGG